MAKTDYLRTDFTGGGASDLDGIDGATLNDGDRGMVITAAYEKWWYVLDASIGGATNSPWLIPPAVNPGSKRWVYLGSDPDSAQIQRGLTCLLLPSVHGGYNDIYKGGWRPAWFNQQWGGAFGGEHPYGHDSEHAWYETEYIEDNGTDDVGDQADASSTWKALAFVPSQSGDYAAVWLKLFKAGNPQKNAEPLAVYITDAIDSDITGNIVANGTMDLVNGHSMGAAAENWPLTSNSDGEWYRFTDASGNFTLAAGTTYYIVVEAQGNDAANYFTLKVKNATSNTYPHGNWWDGDDDAGVKGPTTWTEDTSQMGCFLLEGTAGIQMLQSGGQFDGLLKFIEGDPLDQSQSLVREIKDFWDDQEFTCRIVSEGALTASKPILDAMWGFDHDRIVLYVDGSNHLVLKVYESDQTVHTVTGATAVTGAGVKDIWAHVRSKNDASDVVEITLNGAAEGTPVTAASILFDDDFVELGHVHLGGGFPIAPTWDDDEDMSALPSAGIYTYVDEGGAHEAASFSVQNNRLYQNWPTTNTFTSYYDTGDVLALDNAVGWIVTWKCRIERNDNVAGEWGANVDVRDGTKRVAVRMHEYYVEAGHPTGLKYQMNLMDREHVFVLMGKGSDFYLFIDGKLIVDGTGLMATASANNQIQFGDSDVTAGSNADVIWDYIKYYDAAELFPDVNAFSLSEFVYWSGDKGSLESVLYNNGTPYSVKEYCGLKENYYPRWKWKKREEGATAPTNAGTRVILAEMEQFILCPAISLDIAFGGNFKQDTDQKSCQCELTLNGVRLYTPRGINYAIFYASVANAEGTLVLVHHEEVICGLHKAEITWISQDATSTADAERNMIVEEK